MVKGQFQVSAEPGMQVQAEGFPPALWPSHHASNPHTLNKRGQEMVHSEGRDKIGKICRDPPSFTGVYVDGLVQGVRVTFIIDTGAITTILSNKIYKKISEEQRPMIKKSVVTFHDLVEAGENSLNFHGCGTFEIHLCPLRLGKELSIAEISDKVHLGADILQHDEDGPVDLILSEYLMICQGISIFVQQVGIRLQICHARLVDHHIIPGMSHMDIDTFVDFKMKTVLPRPSLGGSQTWVSRGVLNDYGAYPVGYILICHWESTDNESIWLASVLKTGHSGWWCGRNWGSANHFEHGNGGSFWCWSNSGPLFTTKTPSYQYRDSQYKPETVVRPS